MESIDRSRIASKGGIAARSSTLVYCSPSRPPGREKIAGGWGRPRPRCKLVEDSTLPVVVVGRFGVVPFGK